jgi:hypothetical protein
VWHHILGFVYASESYDGLRGFADLQGLGLVCTLFRDVIEERLHETVVEPHRHRTTDPAWLTGERTVRDGSYDDGLPAFRLSAFGHSSFVLFPRSDGIVALSPGADPKTICVRTVLLGRGPIIEAVEISRVVRTSVDLRAFSHSMYACGCGSWRHHIFHHLKKRVVASATEFCQATVWTRKPGARSVPPPTGEHPTRRNDRLAVQKAVERETRPTFRMRWESTLGTDSTSTKRRFRCAVGSLVQVRPPHQGAAPAFEYRLVKWMSEEYTSWARMIMRADCKQSRFVGVDGRESRLRTPARETCTTYCAPVRLAKAERVPMSDAPIEDENGKPELVICAIDDPEFFLLPGQAPPPVTEQRKTEVRIFSGLRTHFLVVVKALEMEGMLVMLPGLSGRIPMFPPDYVDDVNKLSQLYYGVKVLDVPVALPPPPPPPPLPPLLPLPPLVDQ